MFFLAPKTIGKKYVGLIFVSIKFQKLAPFKIPDFYFIGFKMGKESFNF
jgi:hypothetical protein